MAERAASPAPPAPGRRGRYALAALVPAVLASALGIVYFEHRARVLFVELQALERERDALKVEWGRLQLEQSTWATHDRIERIARERLELRRPGHKSVVVTLP